MLRVTKANPTPLLQRRTSKTLDSNYIVTSGYVPFHLGGRMRMDVLVPVMAVFDSLTLLDSCGVEGFPQNYAWSSYASRSKKSYLLAHSG